MTQICARSRFVVLIESLCGGVDFLLFFFHGPVFWFIEVWIQFLWHGAFQRLSPIEQIYSDITINVIPREQIWPVTHTLLWDWKIRSLLVDNFLPFKF